MARIPQRLGVLTVLSLLVPALASAQSPYTLVSAAMDGSPGNKSSSFPSISSDGRYVAFISYATNLVPNDTNDLEDLFVRDLQTNTTTRINVNSDGSQVTGQFLGVSDPPIISGNGRFVLFQTLAALVPGDTNSTQCFGSPCVDVYVRDLVSHVTTLVSVATNGAVGDNNSAAGGISDDGRYVVFSSTASNLAPGLTNVGGGRSNVFLRDLVAGTTVRVNVGAGGGAPQISDGSASGAAISGDGNVITYFIDAARSANVGDCTRADLVPTCVATAVVDRTSSAISLVHPGFFPLVKKISTDGRYLAMYDNAPLGQLTAGYEIYDRVTNTARPLGPSDLTEPYSLTMRGDGKVALLPQRSGTGTRLMLYDAVRTRPIDLLTDANIWTMQPAISGDGSTVAFASPSLTDLNVLFDDVNIYMTRLDADGDGMLDAWERVFGLNPQDPSDASADPDGDGRTSLQEYLADTNPVGRFTRLLAEGSSNFVFSTYIAILNPNDTATGVNVTFPRGSGLDTMSIVKRIPPHTRVTVDPQGENQNTAYGDFSTIVDSDLPVVVDRTQGFVPSTQALGHGKIAETSTGQASTTWYFAEGATGGPFSLYYLFLNPGDTIATVTVTYLLPSPQPPLTKTYLVPARSRYTVPVDTEDPRLVSNDVSARITSDQPIVAERSMYLASLGERLGAAEGGAGVPEPALEWFLAEGATGSFFDLYVLLANPETTDANVTLTYLLPDGSHFAKDYLVAAQSRLTILVDQEDPRLKDTPVSIVADSTNAVPIVVERAMWWPEGNWYEGHLAAGATVSARKWGLADGDSEPDVETYILVANTSSTPGNATVTLMFEDGTTSARTFPLPANSRTNVRVAAEFPGALGKKFGAVIESDGPNMVVERSMYSTVNGVVWAAGTAALGMPMP